MKLEGIGLDADALEAIRQVLARFSAVEEAILYGSRAKGTFRPGSDIDLTLKGPHLVQRDLLNIAIALDDLLLPWKFDLSWYDGLANQQLIEHIDRIGITLYTRVT